MPTRDDKGKANGGKGDRRGRGDEPDRRVVPLRGKSGGSSGGKTSGGRSSRGGTGKKDPETGTAARRRARPSTDAERVDPPQYRRRTTVRRVDRDPFRPALRLLEGGAKGDKKGGAKPAGGRGSAGRVRGTPTQRQPARTPTRRPRRSELPAARPRKIVKRRLPRLASPGKRLRVGTALLLLVFVVIGGRLVQLQVTDAAAYAADALQQRLYTELEPAERGSILDRDGNALAYSVDARYVYADPEMITDPQGVAERLSPLLGVPASELAPKLQRQKTDDGDPLRFVYLARGVDASVGDAVEGLELDGVRVRHDERREVPGHDLAANILGFTGTDGQGLAGLEASYDELLRGIDGERMYEVGAGGQEIPGGYQREEPARPGTSLQLTIDQDLQFETQRILGSTMESKNAEFGAAVVMDVHTGEVVAMASAPSYDAADPFGYDDELMKDWATQAIVDPGSIHKAIVISAAIEEGLIAPDGSLVVPRTITKGDHTYRDTHDHGRVRMTLGGILAYSSNVGTIELADQLGPEKLYEYQLKYGLGSATGIGVAGEVDGLVQPPENWSGTSHGSIPIGLGVSVTPLQMAAAYAAIANGGTWVQPSIIKSTIAPDGTVTPSPAPHTRQVISKETSDAMRNLLQAPIVVSDGTGHGARLPGYLMAGKTGTGLLVEDGQYAEGEVASFVGFAPADDPQYVVSVFAYTPGGGGGTVTGTAFRDIMSFTMGHFKIPPSTEPEPEFQVYV